MNIENNIFNLEPEVIEIMPEVVSETENLVMLYSVAEQQDVKGLYAKARFGQLKNFTGIDSPYEAPEIPEIHINTTQMSIDEAAEQIVKRCLVNRGKYELETINY